MPNRITSIIFDYAGVLTPVQGFDEFIEKYYEKYGIDKQSLYEILKKDWSKAKIGQMTAKEYWTRIAKTLGEDPDTLESEVLKTFPLDKNVLKLVKNLKNNYSTVLMSNQIENWIEKSLLPEKIEDYFTHNLSSYIIGLKKPDNEAFEFAISHLKERPENILYFDDQKENIVSARDLGINSVEYVEGISLAEVLSKYNIHA